MPTELEFKISYDGGSASDGLLDIYNAGVSTRGLSRALAITVHAFLNDGEIRRRAERARGAKIYLSAPRHGSFEEVIRIVIADPVAIAIGTSATNRDTHKLDGTQAAERGQVHFHGSCQIRGHGHEQLVLRTRTLTI